MSSWKNHLCRLGVSPCNACLVTMASTESLSWPLMPLLVPHSVVWAAAPRSSSRRPRMGLSYRGAQTGPWRMVRTTVQWALLPLRRASRMNGTPGNGQGAGAVVRAKGRGPPNRRRRQVTTPVTSLLLICFPALPCRPAPTLVGCLPIGPCGHQ